MVKIKNMLLALVGIFILSIPIYAQQGAVSELVQLELLVPDFDIDVLTKDGISKRSIKDYRGKVVILEFWATYCGPCFPAMNHLETLQQKFPNDLEVINITDEERWKVINFLKKHPTSMSIAIDVDKSINHLFYHQMMPHTILIDPQGYIKAITSPEQITEETIFLAKSGAMLVVKTKAEFATKNELATAMEKTKQTADNNLYSLVVSAFEEGIQPQINKKSDVAYEFINCTIPMMYQVLYQETLPNPQNGVCLEVSEQTKHLLEEKYQYCLNIKIPRAMKQSLGEVGIKNLEEIFGLKAVIENRNRKVYALSTDKEAIAPTKNGGMDIPLRDFLKLLWDTKVIDMPIVNESETADSSIVWIPDFPKEVSKVQESIRNLGFKLSPKTIEIACLVLYERKSTN
jgi:thiol-disulfide isomerase/thioredoxin